MGILDRIASRAASTDTVSAPLINVSRRSFLQGTGGLAIGLSLGQIACSPKDAGQVAAAVAGNLPPFEPNAFLRIGADNRVVVIAKHL